MYSDGAEPELPSRPSSLSRRSSTASIAPKEPQSRVSQRQPDEKTRLCVGDGDMSQRQARPASASISCSSRPSSLFWTAPEAEPVQSRGSGPRSYGTTETLASSAVEDDPYGYQALAGPSLLPSFHEQQMKQQKEREVNSRTRGPSIAAIKRRGWLIVAVACAIVILGTLIYVLL